MRGVGVVDGVKVCTEAASVYGCGSVALMDGPSLHVSATAASFFIFFCLLLGLCKML